MSCSKQEKRGTLGSIDEESPPEQDIDKEAYELCDPSLPRYVPNLLAAEADGTYVDFTREPHSGRQGLVGGAW